MCPGGGDSRGLVRHPADLVPWGLPPGGGLCGRPPAIGCGWRSALYVRVACSVEGLLTTGICPLACAGLATVLTMRFVGRAGRSATGVRNFAIIGIASMAAVSVTAAPAMGLAIVDSMTVPGDRRYSEGLLGTFALIAGICLTLAIGALVGTVVAALRGGEGRTGTGRWGLFLVFAATLAATIPVSVLWKEYGHLDLPMIHFPRPVEAGIWFAIVVTASVNAATVVAAKLRRHDIVAGMGAMATVFLVTAVASPTHYLLVAGWYPFYLVDAPPAWAMVAYYAFALGLVPSLAVGVPIRVGLAHATAAGRPQASSHGPREGKQ